MEDVEADRAARAECSPDVILSVSPRYGLGTGPERLASHWTAYQQDLAAAAGRAGLRFEVIGPKQDVERTEGATLDPPVVSQMGVHQVIEDADGVGWVSAIEAVLDRVSAERPLVLMYEGRLEHLAAFAALAADHPSAMFVLNLFKSQFPFDIPRGRRIRRTEPGSFVDRAAESLARNTPAFMPCNLHLLAETPRREFLARAMGLEVSGSWQLHSQLAEMPELRPFARSAASPEESLRILVSLPPSKTTRETMVEVSEVVRAVRRSGADMEWTFTVSPSSLSRYLRRTLRSVRHSVTFDEGALELEAYSARIDHHDAVWLPVRGVYNVQSSGKALDALCRARPVIAPAGTFGAEAMGRWVPGAPSYGTALEAAELFAALRLLVPHLQRGLLASEGEIRAAYSPSTTIRSIMALGRLPRGSGLGS